MMSEKEVGVTKCPMQIERELSVFVSGQSKTKRVLSILGYNHYLRYYRNLCPGISPSAPPRLTGLITGPTGTGKTYLPQCLAKVLDFPFLHIDATSITKTGFTGNASMKEHFDRLSCSIERTVLHDRINYAIVFIDEIDKLGGRMATTTSDDWNYEIQAAMLTALDGGMVGPYNTEKMLFILAGAFEPTYEDRMRKRKEVGFMGKHTTDDQIYDDDLTREEVEKAGIRRELLGRIHVLTHTTRLTKAEIKKVLVEVQDNILDQFTSLMMIGGGMPDPKRIEKDIDKMVDDLHNIKNKYGMRYVKTIMFDYFKEDLFYLDGVMKPSPDDALSTQSLTTYTPEDYDKLDGAL